MRRWSDVLLLGLAIDLANGGGIDGGGVLPTLAILGVLVTVVAALGVRSPTVWWGIAAAGALVAAPATTALGGRCDRHAARRSVRAARLSTGCSPRPGQRSPHRHTAGERTHSPSSAPRPACSQRPSSRGCSSRASSPRRASGRRRAIPATWRSPPGASRQRWSSGPARGTSCPWRAGSAPGSPEQGDARSSAYSVPTTSSGSPCSTPATCTSSTRIYRWEVAAWALAIAIAAGHDHPDPAPLASDSFVT